MSTDFSSIDRLVEFGMGLAVAKQMISTMNTVMNNTQVAGVNAGTTGQTGAVSAPYTSEKWYVAIDNRQAGPLTPAEVEHLVANGTIHDNTLIWRAGMTGWQMACNIPEINKLFLLNKI
ncbi:MAG: DUF4339 domain-containing protein [Bacteroidales bacterium]|nr:DUF4339 domain-containing protein [Bacteroidales bacterium]MDE6801398.1 DUF4339 domain-containing protein [Muribaculaceae bacterium]MDE6832357.1 DUF4339 domain-containing protein [Muribaculaceae bacterium]